MNKCNTNDIVDALTESLGNVTVRGEKRWKEQGGSAIVSSLSEHV
jgi:hypothetical protein